MKMIKMARSVIILGFFHSISALVFIVHLCTGPPMGESMITPWDIGAAISALLSIVLCPILWICIAVRLKLQTNKEKSEQEHGGDAA